MLDFFDATKKYTIVSMFYFIFLATYFELKFKSSADVNGSAVELNLCGVSIKITVYYPVILQIFETIVYHFYFF